MCVLLLYLKLFTGESRYKPFRPAALPSYPALVPLLRGARQRCFLQALTSSRA